MKVTERTRDRLVVEDVAWRVGLILLAGSVTYPVLLLRDGEPLWQSLTAVVCFGAMAWWSTYRARAVFDRGEAAVHIEERRVGWRPRRLVPIGEIAAVELLEWYSLWSSTWRIELKLRGGPNVPLLLQFTGRDDAQASVAAAVAKFLDVPLVKRAGRD